MIRDGEAAELVAGLLPRHVHAADGGGGRPLVQGLHERVERAARPFGDDRHRAAGLVADEAPEVEPPGRAPREVPEADALDAPTHLRHEPRWG